MKVNGVKFLGLLIGLIGFVMLSSLVSENAPSFLVSSITIIALVALVVFIYGPVSIPTFIFTAAFVPSMAFIYAWVRGAYYINYHNHWLQDDQALTDQAVFFSMVSILFATSILFLFHGKWLQRSTLFGQSFSFSKGAYLFSMLATLFFIWLTEPTFNTILTSNYANILDSRIEGAQFAGGLALIFWLVSFGSYSANTTNSYQLKWRNLDRLDRMFIVVTILSVIWLLLHARRSELIGIAVIWLLAVVERKGASRALALAGMSAGALIVVEVVRGVSLTLFLSEGTISSGPQNIASLPGGASNVFMTLVNTIDYFENQLLFAGETFWNYMLQILPKFVYGILNLDIPDYFTTIVFRDYSYNGGTYFGAIFYGNFGAYGAAISGLFIALYVVISMKLIASRQLVVRVIGLYMVAIVFRALWYGLLTLLKPIVVVLIPSYIILTMSRGGRRRYRKSRFPAR